MYVRMCVFISVCMRPKRFMVRVRLGITQDAKMCGERSKAGRQTTQSKRKHVLWQHKQQQPAPRERELNSSVTVPLVS